MKNPRFLLSLLLLTASVHAADHRSWRLGEDDPGAADGTAAQAATVEALNAKNLTLSGTGGAYSSDVPAGGSTLALSLTGSSHYTTDDASVFTGVDLTNFQLSFDAKPTSAPSFHIAVCLGRYGANQCAFIYYTSGIWHYPINGIHRGIAAEECVVHPHGHRCGRLAGCLGDREIQQPQPGRDR